MDTKENEYKNLVKDKNEKGNKIEESDKGVTSVAEYIKVLTEIINNRKKDNLGKYTIVYRGEQRAYPVPGMPGIYRDDYLSENEFYEKNIIDELNAHRLTEGHTKLEIAVDAQHDGMISRLLDVSYNSLVALNFAVTPYYKEKIDQYDKENGQVIIYFINQMFCPSNENTINTFEEIVNRKNDLTKTPVFGHNHKLIDHANVNRRIEAQSGAFILFQGDEYVPVPERLYETIIINHKAKPVIREQLRTFFGIHNGSIYPEVYNLSDFVSEKAKKVDNRPFTFKSEAELYILGLKEDLDLFTQEMKKIIRDSDNDKECSLDKIKYIEEKLMEYKINIEESIHIMEKSNNNKFNEDDLIYVKSLYNKEIDRYIFNFKILCSKYDIEMSEDELKLK